MPLPHKFLAGEIAKSSQVNDNFNYVEDLLGKGSTPGRVAPLGEFLFGARSNSLLTGAHDTGAAGYEFFQIGWNADWNRVTGGVWKFARFIEGKPSTALRLGVDGLSVYTTSSSSGDLNAQMRRVFHINATTGDDYVFLPIDWHFQQVDRAATSIENYRLLYTPFNSPPYIYDNVSTRAGSVTKRSTDYGVPSYAKAISISATITTLSSVPSILSFYRIEGTSGRTISTTTTTTTAPRTIRGDDGDSVTIPGTTGTTTQVSTGVPRHGFDVAARADSYAGGTGIVALGSGAYENQFNIKQTADLKNVRVYITGYWS